MALITIQTTSSHFPQTRFEGLLEHGADVTSGDECGLSCIERGMHDVEIYALHPKRVANVPSQYIISAIETGNPDGLERLLKSGTDPVW